MKLMERIIYIIIIIGLVVYSVQKPRVNTEYSTIPGDTVFNTIYIDSLIPSNTIIYSTDTIWLIGDTIKKTDTVFIYNDYFKMYEYKVDTNISDVDVNINSFVTQNRLYKQNLSLKNNRDVLIQAANNGLFIGGIVGRNLLSPIVSCQHGNHNFGVGYNIINNGGIMIKYEYKIKLKW